MITEKDLIGALSGFPIEVVGRMLVEQVGQGNPMNIQPFQIKSSRDKSHGGFDWNKTEDGTCFWEDVIYNRKFDMFFERYPKQLETVKDWVVTLPKKYSELALKKFDKDILETEWDKFSRMLQKSYPPNKVDDDFLFWQKVYNAQCSGEEYPPIGKEKETTTTTKTEAENMATTKTEATEKKSMINTFMNKFKSQFLPEKEEGLKLSMDGNICVPVNGEYVGINKENELISYPEEMCIDMPVYTISKPFSKVAVGEIIKVNKSFAKVLVVNKDGSFKCLTYSGYSTNKREVKDFILNQALVKTVFNMFGGSDVTSGFNPMMFACMSDGANMQDIMMMQMMQSMQGGAQSANPMAMMMPMMMLDKAKDGEGGSSMMETMMMMQMMQGGGAFNPFASMATPVAKTPVDTDSETGKTLEE